MIKTEIGNARLGSMTVTYSMVAEQLPKGGITYGVEVRTSKGEGLCIRDVTASPVAIRSLLELLIRNTVTPVTLWDVIEDWLP